MKRARVLLAEDSWAMARQLRAILEQEFDVVGTVADGVSLVQVARSTEPDIVVTDIAMPGMDGLDAIAQLLGDRDQLGVVFITVLGDSQLVDRALSLGTCSYVLKGDAGDDLLLAVQAALERRTFLSKSVAYLAHPN
ncbi:MAG: response regulator transcription factor [Pseudoxanthomonas sp.]